MTIKPSIGHKRVTDKDKYSMIRDTRQAKIDYDTTAVSLK